MPQVYLHIGTRKTGTTSIQEFLCKNQRKLLEIGYLYPNSGRPKHYPIAHYNFALYIEFGSIVYHDPIGKHEDVGDQLSQLRGEIKESQASDVVISCENFSNAQENVNKLRDSLADYDVKIIAYLRPQVDFIPSLYVQSIKAGNAEKLSDFIAGRPHLGDYYQYLMPWAQAFGKEHVIVRPFQKHKMKGNSLFEDFLAQVGIHDVSGFNLETGNSNVRPDAKVVNSIKFLNAICISQLSIPRHVCKEIYIDRLLYSKKWQLLAQMSPDVLIPQELFPARFSLEQYCKVFEESNQRVAAEYLQFENSCLFD